MSGTPASAVRLIQPLVDAPAESAALLDVDGTLAPIVEVPSDASVPDDTRQALREIARRLALVACISGRRAIDARRVVGVDEITYVGNHGLEVLAPGRDEPALDPAAEARSGVARDFASSLEGGELESVGMRLEDKGPIQALHWRRSPDPAAAEREARRIADRAERAGLEPRWGRKVLELRPTAGIDKGTAVRRLLEGRGVKLALFAGDDTTDLDAFNALRSMVDSGGLRAAVCLGIGSAEAPPGLGGAADALLESPAELAGVLHGLSMALGSEEERAPR
ncbi:MAG: trehalose-phosphatase [Solirubrobacterales bacterium]